jgi:benzylsuccinate CoA-transferase BbsF subunit
MNKKSVTIDMGSPEGLDLAKKMVSTADIIFDNMRPGALAKLGLGYDSASNLKEDIIVASSSGRGSVGPESQYLGYAMIHHAIGGNAYITGYPDEHPCHTTGDVDIMNATMLAYAILAAVHHRDRTGEGQFIDYSQTEAVSSLIGEVLLGYEMTGVNPERVGNQHHQYAPHNVYKAWGVNRWIAIEVHDDDQFKSLADAMGQPDLASDPKFATCEARKQNEQELDGIVEAWTSKRDRDRTTRLLISAGVAAAPSRDSRDLYADRHLQERGAFVKVDHPDLGELELISTPWKLDGLQVDAVRAPFLGEHSDEVIKDIVGLDDAGMKALRDSGIVQ